MRHCASAGARSGAASICSCGEGEFVAILGPNGAGKSTLLEVLLGLLRARAAERSRCWVAGRVRATSASVTCRSGGCSTRARGCAGSTSCGWAWTGVAGACRCRWRDASAPGRALSASGSRRRSELVGASAYAGRPIGECSGGEQQRLLIAQALVQSPRMLILDEPLDGLDLPNQAAVAALVQGICRARGVTVLLVAHDVNPLLPYVDRVLYLAGGRRGDGNSRAGDHERDAERLVWGAGGGAQGA